MKAKQSLMVLAILSFGFTAGANENKDTGLQSAKISARIAEALFQASGSTFNVTEVDSSGNMVPGTAAEVRAETGEATRSIFANIDTASIPVVWEDESGTTASPVVQVGEKQYVAYTKGGNHKRPTYKKSRKTRIRTCMGRGENAAVSATLAVLGVAGHYLTQKQLNKPEDRTTRNWAHAGIGASADLGSVVFFCQSDQRKRNLHDYLSVNFSDSEFEFSRPVERRAFFISKISLRQDPSDA
jgi:hypothetical protein